MDLTKLTNYEVLEQRALEDLKSEGALLRHKKSGAKIVLISNEDNNKVFDIVFRTPVANSTGVPHILEHTVFCGSEKFPAKDPFMELAMGSLNTFLNAMTAPDRTMYPVASCNEKDFQNLMDVYMDAVLHPNLYKHEEIFRQEGWSYQLEDPNGELMYNGVVYNEMKGAFSSPDTVLADAVRKSLFPDTTYRYESGGDPKEIPSLTYEEYLDFHRSYYHPSNSYIYLYGDMDMTEKLEWLDEEYLSHYDEKKVDSEIELQKPFEEVRDITATYAIGTNESVEDNAYLSYNKVIGTTLDEKLYLAFQILDYALLSAPGAPITMALLANGIGRDVYGSYDTNYYQPVFSVVARNANESQKEDFVQIIEGVLGYIAENGMDRKALEAGINFYEFRYREADFGGYPKGLVYGMQMMESWTYDETRPFLHLEAIPTFEFLKSQLDTGYFESLIKTYLLDNTHGSIVTVVPEQGAAVRQDEALREQLSAYKASLSDEEVMKLVEDTYGLIEYQQTPSSEEDMLKIPVLTKEDITKEGIPVYNEEMTLAGVPTVFHEIETNGIGYLSLMFGMEEVPEELLPYAGVLMAALGMVDTEHYSYGELFNEVNVHTGGISGNMEIYPDVTRIQEKAFRSMFEVKGKALYEKLPVAASMMQEMLMCSKFDDEMRLREILAMTASRLQMELMSSGHSAAARRALSYCSPIDRFKDMTDGIEFYQWISHLNQCFDEEKETLIDKLQQLTKILFRQGNMIVSYTAAREGLAGLEGEIEKLNAALNEARELPKRGPISCERKNEGFKCASQVQFVAKAGNFADAGLKYTGAFQVMKVLMNFDYLWMNIRMMGGAYGCSSDFNRIGEGYFVSYRDPNLAGTLGVYDSVPDFLTQFDAGERDITKYIIGAISNIDQPLTPFALGERSMGLYMNNVSADMLAKEREEILRATPEDIRALAAAAKAVLAQEQICVIGSELAIDESSDVFMNVNELA